MDSPSSFWSSRGSHRDPDSASRLKRSVTEVQLQGRNLVPFHFDKQTLLLETLLNNWMCATGPRHVNIDTLCASCMLEALAMVRVRANTTAEVCCPDSDT